MNTSSYSAESILRSCLQTAEKQDGLPCKNIVFSNSSRIRRKRKFYYIIFFGVCVGGFKNFFGFLEIWCEMLGLEGENEWNRTRHAVSLQEKASCRNKTISEPLPHKADPTERSWRGVLWCCRDTARRVRWFYVKAHPVGNVPPERFQNIGTVNGTQGRSGLVRSALEKLSLFSPTFPVRQKHGAGNFAVCGQRLRGHVPSKRVCFASRRMQIAPSDFSRDERKNRGNPLWISEYFPEISRKRCKQDVCE